MANTLTRSRHDSGRTGRLVEAASALAEDTGDLVAAVAEHEADAVAALAEHHADIIAALAEQEVDPAILAELAEQQRAVLSAAREREADIVEGPADTQGRRARRWPRRSRGAPGDVPHLACGQRGGHST